MDSGLACTPNQSRNRVKHTHSVLWTAIGNPSQGSVEPFLSPSKQSVEQQQQERFKKKGYSFCAFYSQTIFEYTSF
jgi:hypothetical protein